MILLISGIFVFDNIAGLLKPSVVLAVANQGDAVANQGELVADGGFANNRGCCTYSCRKKQKSQKSSNGQKKGWQKGHFIVQFSLNDTRRESRWSGHFWRGSNRAESDPLV